MFTGIVQEMGRVESVAPRRGGVLMRIGAEGTFDDLEVGESVAVDGVCLTVVEVGSGSFEVEGAEETLRRTTLGMTMAGRMVNLERALRSADRLGGHLVTGHVDGLGRILSVAREGLGVLCAVEIPSEHASLVVEKGSVALDGVSLTPFRVDNNSFFISVVPHTWQATTLSRKQVGELVNVEFDIIAKYVARFLSVGKRDAVTEKWLDEQGY